MDTGCFCLSAIPRGPQSGVPYRTVCGETQACLSPFPFDLEWTVGAGSKSKLVQYCHEGAAAAAIGPWQKQSFDRRCPSLSLYISPSVCPWLQFQGRVSYCNVRGPKLLPHPQT